MRSTTVKFENKIVSRAVYNILGSDMALIKILYLAQLNIAKNWKAPLRNWPETVSQLSIWFADRLKLTLA